MSLNFLFHCEVKGGAGASLVQGHLLRGEWFGGGGTRRYLCVLTTQRRGGKERKEKESLTADHSTQSHGKVKLSMCFSN
jgi:hypothetical protein